MFITETFAKEYIERYVNENLRVFQDKQLIIHTVGEQGINLYELLSERNIDVLAFAESSPKLISKKIYGLPVIKLEEIPTDSFIIVSSPTNAKRDKKRLIALGHKQENILMFYPTVISQIPPLKGVA